MTQPENNLATLNALRSKVGRGPLKKWKDSQTKLVETIALLRNEVLRVSVSQAKITKVPSAVAAGAYKTNTEAAILTGHTTEGATRVTKRALARLQREEGKRKKKAEKADAPVETKAKASPAGMTLVQIAKRIPMDGRHARQKMRRVYAGDVSKLPKRINGAWVFAPKDADKVEKLLRADHRKNGN